MPIYSLADLRATAPANLRDASDVELVKAYSDSTGVPLLQVAEQLGMPTGKDRNALAAGLSSGADDLQGLGYSAVAAGADALGLKRARDWANRRADINQVESQLNGRPDLENIEDVYDQPGKWLPYAAYQVSKQAPNIAATVAASLALPEVAVPGMLARGAAVLPRVVGGGGLRTGMTAAEALAARKAGETFARTVVGGGAVNYAQGVGSLYQEANDGGDPNAGLSALAGGLPYAVTETLPEAMLIGRIGHGSGFKGGLATRMAKAGGTQAAAGATSELLQNEMEMAYNGRVSPEQAMSRRLNSGVAGGLVEGILGSAGGVRRGRVPVKTVDQGSTDLLSLVPEGDAAYSGSQAQTSQQGPLGDLTVDPQWTTSAGAAAPRLGLQFTRDIDTGNLEIVNDQRDPSLIDFTPPGPAEPLWTTAPGATAQTGGLPFTREVDTSHLAVTDSPAPRQGLDFSAPVDMLAGRNLSLVPTEQQAPASVPMEQAPARGELSLAPAGAPLADPRTGVPYELQVDTSNLSLAPKAQPTANTLSPKGKAINDLALRLQDEGHLDDGTTTQVTTLIAQGKFAAAKKILDVAVKEKSAADALAQKAAKIEEKTNANPAGAGEQRPGAPAVAGGVQPAGSQPDAAGVRGAAATASEPARTGGEAAPAVPAGEHNAALTDEDNPNHAVTSDALVQVADDAKDIHEYEGALDELYRRWRDEGDETAAQYFEANAKVPGFAADLARVRQRAGEAPKAAPQERGKRGLKLGRQENGKLTEQAKQTDEVMRGLATIKQAAARNPDGVHNENKVPEGVQFESGKAAAEWLADNAQQPFIRFLMRKLAPYLDNVNVKVLNVNDMVPARIAAHLNGTARAVTVRPVDPKLPTSIWLRGYDGHTEEVWAHELVHAATMARLQDKTLRAPLRSLAAHVRAALIDLAQSYDSNTETYEFFQRMFRDTDEFLAYSMTAPSFQELLQKLGPDGNPLPVFEPEATRPVPKLTMWQKFVDFIRGLFNLPKVYAQQLQEVLDANAAIEARNANPPAQATLGDEIHRLLDELLSAPAPAVTDEQTIAGTREDKAVSDPGGVAQVQANSTEADPAGQAMAGSFAKIPYANTTLGQKIQDALFNLRESPWALKWTTNDQIAEGYKHLKPVQDINRATGRMGAVANRYMENAVQTAKRWRALADDVQLAMQRVMLQSTMDEMHVSVKDAGQYLSAEAAWAHELNAHIEKTPANRAKFGKLYQEFHALPAAAKAVYDQVRDDLTRQHEDTLAALRKSVAEQYTGQLKRLLTDAELKALAESPAGVRNAFKDIADVAASATELRALGNLYQQLRDITSDFGTVKGPYFPLVRFGDHVVVMKSADLVDLESHAAGLRQELQQAMDSAPPAASDETEGYNAKIADIRGRYNRALEAVAAAKQDERKYIVEFHESPAQAERARLALAERFPQADVYRSVREQYYRALDGASPAFLKNLQETLAAALDSGDGVSAEAKNTALQSMRDMYLRRQPERSALRAELKRMSIEGVQSAQMLRGYAQTARNGAWRISRLQHAGEVTQALAALSEDRRSADAKHVLNELKARFVGDLAPASDNKWLSRLGNATYFMHLGFNLSYFTTNATQAWAISLPVMAGRHGIVNSANSLMAASKDVIRLLSQATAKSIEENGAVVGLQLRLTDEQISSLAKDAGEAQMLKALTDDGVIDITIKHDLGAISDGTTKSFPGKVMELSSALANYPELYNRLSTALAAYRMEVGRREGGAENQAQVQDRAEKYAEYIINRTHFNYSPENAPRMMRGQLGRLVFQFKRYQQGMIYLFAKLVKDASGGDKAAARSLTYLLGMTTAVGGVAALPIAAPVALATKLIAAMYPDDDEPELLQQWYNGMKDGVGEPIAQMLAKGLPTLAGLDLSGKLGQGDILNPAAFADTAGKKVFSKDYWQAVGFGLLGPSSALIANEMQAVGYAKDGAYLKAAESGMPAFLANAVKALRRADEGITTKQGDTLMEPAEFNALATVMKAAGFESAKVSDMYQQRSAYMNAVTARQDARRGLLRDYYEAVRSGDGEKVTAAQEAIAAFNGRQQADRIKGSDLQSSMRQHAQRSAEMRGGLRVGKRDADTYSRLTGQ
jgi:hypothetical protein